MRGLKIAFLGNQIYYGGGAKSLYLLIRSLRPHVKELHLFVTHIASEQMKGEFLELADSLHHINLPEFVGAQTESPEENTALYTPSASDAEQISAFVSKLNALQIDILHINNSVFSPIYRELRKNGKFRIVTHVREWLQWNGIHAKQKFIIETIERNSDAIVCISDKEGEPFEDQAKVTVIANPLDFSEIEKTGFDRSATLKELGIPVGTIVVGMMGSFQKSKGVMNFFEALKIISSTERYRTGVVFLYLGQTYPNLYHRLKFLRSSLLGRESFFRDVFRYLRKNHLGKRAVFVKNTKNIYRIVDCFDIAVRPSFSGDPWGRDIIEYMAMAKPMVVTGDSAFFVKEGVNGLHVKPGSSEELAERIMYLLDHPTRREELGRKGYELVREKCDFENYHREILKIYDSLVPLN